MAVLTALVMAVHSPEQSKVLVGEVARIANRVLVDQKESLKLTPHMVGDLLTLFGVHNKRRTNKGWLLEFDQELRRKIHLLIKRYGADCNVASVLFEVSPNCKFCKDLHLLGEDIVATAP